MKITVQFANKVTVGPLPACIFFDRNRHSYLMVNKGVKYSCYLTLRDGCVEVIKMGISEQGSLLIGCGSMYHAALVYYRSYLTKTSQAMEILQRILKGEEILM